ncbi:MAG: PKD domain-containing protein [Archangiaceae bacterium]|nr:PKD domain-containing protein [Archangiaceae bacterium]
MSPEPADSGEGAGSDAGAVDGGAQCSRDSDCGGGLKCLRSTGQCVLDEGSQVDDPDAGGLSGCFEGETASCGSSKLGECRLGLATCTGGAFGPCVGAVEPTAELCNGRDDDCDGLIDEDLAMSSCGLGVCARVLPACANGAPVSCVPGTPTLEVCNGLDDDCDGMTDEGFTALSCGVGACARTTPACVLGMPQVCLPGSPAAEACNGVDDDCNGMTDENLGSSTCGVGVCQRTVQSCVAGTPRTCVPGAAEVETCNNLDDDCDGQTDEGLANLTCGVGACLRSVTACTGGVASVCTPGTAGAETCNGVDDDCDGTVDDGVCGPAGMCPGNRTVNPNTSVALPTAASSPAGRPITCQWSVVSRPATSTGTFSAPTSCVSSNYLADVVGTHTLRFTVTDSMGLSTSCTLDVVVNALGNLWIELTWNRNDDLDLHLSHPSAGNSHNANGWAFNAGGFDCYFGDTNPSWDAAGIADDPSLDLDDTSRKGPENIRVNTPVTTHDYNVGVHWYSQVNAANNVTATVKVYCSNVLVTTQTKQLTAVEQMWVVGKVRFAANGTCTYTNDGFTFSMPP